MKNCNQKIKTLNTTDYLWFYCKIKTRNYNIIHFVESRTFFLTFLRIYDATQMTTLVNQNG